MRFRQRNVLAIPICLALLSTVAACSPVPQKEYERTPTSSTVPTESPEEKLKRETIENYEYQYDDSAGIYYIGNGQVIEYVHDSFAELCYTLDHLTQYQRTSAEEAVDGRYVLIEGTVTQVSGDGEVTILCLDEEASKKAELIWPMEAFADVSLVKEQEDILGAIAIDDTISVLARINTDETPLIFSGYDGDDGVALFINGRAIDVPIIQGLGYNDDNKIENTTQQYEDYAGVWISLGADNSYDVQYGGVMVELSFDELIDYGFLHIVSYQSGGMRLAELTCEGPIVDGQLHFSGEDGWLNQVEGTLYFEDEGLALEVEVVETDPQAQWSLQIPYEELKRGN